MVSEDGAFCNSAGDMLSCLRENSYREERKKKEEQDAAAATSSSAGNFLSWADEANEANIDDTWAGLTTTKSKDKKKKGKKVSVPTNNMRFSSDLMYFTGYGCCGSRCSRCTCNFHVP